MRVRVRVLRRILLDWREMWRCFGCSLGRVHDAKSWHVRWLLLLWRLLLMLLRRRRRPGLYLRTSRRKYLLWTMCLVVYMMSRNRLLILQYLGRRDLARRPL